MDWKAVRNAVVQAFEDINTNDVHIRSLATTLMPWEDPPTKTATLNFERLPSAIENCLSKGEWTLGGAANNNSLILDSHFLGLTPLNDVRPEKHDYEYVLRYFDGNVLTRAVALLSLALRPIHSDRGSPKAVQIEAGCGSAMLYQKLFPI